MEPPPVKTGFEVRNPYMRDWLRDQSLQLSGNVTEVTKGGIQRAIRDGLREGKGVEPVARRIEEVFAEADRKRSRLIARTELNKAANGASWLSATNLGVVKTKTWLATKDGRTRREHRDINGETVPLDKPFSNGLMFPSEPNCRCTMTYDIVDRRQSPEIPTEIREPGDFRTIGEAEAWGRKNYPHMEWDLTGMDLRLANATLGQFKKVADDFPEVAGRMSFLRTAEDPPGGDNRWYARAYGRSGRSPAGIEFNRHHYDDPDSFQKRLDYDEYTGFHPKGSANPEFVLTHEFGHQVDYWLESLNDVSVLPYIGQYDAAGVVSDTFRTWKFNNWRHGKRISRYGKQNLNEGWAENFAAMYHSPTANRIKYVKGMRKLLGILANPKNHRKDFKDTGQILDREELSRILQDLFDWKTDINLYGD